VHFSVSHLESASQYHKLSKGTEPTVTLPDFAKVSIQAVHFALASAVNGDVTISQWEWDITFKGVGRVQMAEAAVRHWKGGQVSSERFYHSK
jgi:hypothetical protein